MPPAVDTPQEVAVIIGGVVVIISAGLAGLVSIVGGVVMLWRRKVKPILTSTQVAASTAADQLTPNHGSSIRDAVGRIESKVIELHADARLDRAQVGRRLERLEAYHTAPPPIQENTRP